MDFRVACRLSVVGICLVLGTASCSGGSPSKQPASNTPGSKDTTGQANGRAADASTATGRSDGGDAGQPQRDAGGSTDSGARADGSAVGCGDGVLANGEECDDGNTVTESCAYGQASCTVCDAQCKNATGVASQCGDHTTDTAAGEECDDGNLVTEDCAYGELDCTVCSASCTNAAGVSSFCGDGTIDVANAEQCDDHNAVTESCAYGEASCTVCDAQCKNGAGMTSACGDHAIDAAAGEECDDGNLVTESCSYGQTSCTVCDAQCKNAAGASAYCGDGAIDASAGEQCDDGGTAAGDGCDASCHTEYVASCGNGTIDAAAGENCDDGNTNNQDGCSAACKRENGWTCASANTPCSEICGDSIVVGQEVCDDGNQVDGDYCANGCRIARRCGDSAVQSAAGEDCDDGNTLTERCAYGQTSCTVCNSSCKNGAGLTSYCGDGVIDSANAEQCDDHNTTTESCAYGATSCVVCDATCKTTAGATRYCGDGIVQAGNGEECDDSGDMRCNGSCKLQCDTVYISYATTGSFQLTDTALGLGDGTFAQSGGTYIVALPAGRTGPVPGPAGAVYLRMPISFTQTINFAGTTTITTNVVGLAGTQSNLCPLSIGTLNGSNQLLWDVLGPGETVACPYQGSHGTTTWTPAEQQVPTGHGPGCLEYSSTGNINCSGPLCGSAGLMSGNNPVNDQWDQPGAGVVFSNAFAKAQVRGLGTPAPGGSRPTDKVEVPDNANSRSWINFDGVETSRSCAWKPANCSAPGAQ